MHPTPNRLPLLERLLPYYLQCVLEDEDISCRAFLSDEGKQFLELPLSQELGLARQATFNLTVDDRSRWFANSLRQQRASVSLFYGYPLYVEWKERSERGWKGGFAIPVFLQQVEHVLAGSVLQLRLTPEWPRINGEFLQRVFATIEERRSFIDEIGLVETGDPPADGLAAFGRRLHDLDILPEVEPLTPESLGLIFTQNVCSKNRPDPGSAATGGTRR